MIYRAYFYWKNRRSTTHIDCDTFYLAIQKAKQKARNSENFMSVEILPYTEVENIKRIVISKEELLTRY